MQEHQAWVVAVDMGYGHQRAIYPFREMAFQRVFDANQDEVVTAEEMKQWHRFQQGYETVSRLGGLPGVGRLLWEFYDSFQRIAKRYPMRDLSRPTMVTKGLAGLIKRGFGQSVVDHIVESRPELPMLTSFYVPALAADRAGLDRIFCIVTDTDLHRVWVAQQPCDSHIIYCAPTIASRRRLLSYGVPEDHIHLTGFPLPEVNVEHVRDDLRRRLSRLDPQRLFYPRLKEVIIREVGELQAADGPVTITFAVGGAGAQKEVGAKLLANAVEEVRAGRLRINLVAGIRREVADYFETCIQEAGLEAEIGKGVRILLEPDKPAYFERFNEWLRETDVLWTKPSELVFYAALGIPLVMSEPLGAHEEYNREWIREMGAGFIQEDPRYAVEWLTERIACGMLAEAAFDGYLKAPRQGTANVKRLLAANDSEMVALDYNEAYSPMQIGTWRRRWVHPCRRRRGWLQQRQDKKAAKRAMIADAAAGKDGEDKKEDENE